MPELPEVESIRLQLQKYIIGHRITDVEIRYGKKFVGDTKDLIGASITEVRRFGKAQVIDLDNGYSIVIHVKMTGQLIYEGPNLKQVRNLSKKITGGLGGKHTHIIFHLDKNGTLYFNDVRKFGWLHVVKTDEIKNHKFLGQLGPEPVVDPVNLPINVLTEDLFRKILSKSGRPIKIVLMDQSKMAGVGNIYANDALWLAGINPKKESKKLGTEEIKKLYDAIHTVLKAGLKYGGASEQAFVTPDGAEGEYQNHTLAYGHEGEVCGRCKKAKIEKYFLGGRGTYRCPNCQT